LQYFYSLGLVEFATAVGTVSKHNEHPRSGTSRGLYVLQAGDSYGVPQRGRVVALVQSPQKSAFGHVLVLKLNQLKVFVIECTDTAAILGAHGPSQKQYLVTRISEVYAIVIG
jgi:hypothetical protein